MFTSYHKIISTNKFIQSVLLNKIKCRLNLYFVFIIILLVIRLIAVIPMAIDFSTGDDLIVPTYETLVWLISEILPVLVMMFSFISFGSSSNDNVEQFDESISVRITTSINESAETHVLNKTPSSYFINEESDSVSEHEAHKENEDKKEKLVLGYSFSDCK